MRVGLGFFNHAGWSEANLKGIASFARPNRPWTFDLLAPTLEGIEQLIALKPDGLLLGTSDDEVLARVERSGIPAVNTGAPSPRQVHQVGNDEQLIGVLAAKHFITRGYKRFAYVARTGTHPDARLDAFSAHLGTVGAECSVYAGTRGSNPAVSLVEDDDSLAEWLKALAKPVAVFCMFDYQAWVVAEECLRAGIKVPADVAVLGVDNQLAQCLLCNPPLSSIQTAAERIGYEAAALLERVLASPKLGRQILMVPPVRIVNRRSTDAVAASDRLVGFAMTLMRDNLGKGLSIEDVCSKLKCSRRSLERRFHACIGMTPAQTWARFRVEEAQRLLADTDLTVEAIASHTGLGDGRQVAAAIRKATGLTPMKFRRNASL
ncbi:MAG: substrate-binding domain-containing protein [Polyangiaceae bacterium]|nr:substrate-binding domain-containing protein [Polyangiaceae bacterium]